MNDPFLNGNGNHGPIDRVADWLKSESSTRALGWLTLTLLVGLLVLGGLAVPRIVSNTDASRRTDDLGACRDQYRLEVDNATQTVLEVFGAQFKGHGRQLKGVGKAAVAAIRQDVLALQASAEFLEDAESATDAAEVALDEALRLRADASADYSAALIRSSEDPEGFLAECKEENQP